MRKTPFELKIALIGNVSAGKTTLLNAILGDKYGEVSMKRTTAGINYFRLHSPTPNSGNGDDSLSALSFGGETRSAKSILTEVSEDNVRLRQGEKIEEKYFDVQLKQDLMAMRKDTQLVLVDIPGMNEANSSKKYSNYVTEIWDTFDLVLVVMDGRQGVNTEEQVFLLKFVKENLAIKDIPVIILSNKIDEQENEEQTELVMEAQKEVEKIFQVGCRTKALQALFDPVEFFIQKPGQYHPPLNSSSLVQLSPAFLPISAAYAYIFRCASMMSLNEFRNFDKELIGKLGREQIGRQRWKKLTEEQKILEAYKVVIEEKDDGIEQSNFHKFHKILQAFLAGDKNQLQAIEQQILIALKNLSKRPFKPGVITKSIYSIYNDRKRLKRSSPHALPQGENLPQAFWASYQEYEDEAFKSFQSTWPNGFHELAGPMHELMLYHNLLRLPDLHDDKSRTIIKMKEIINRMISCMLERQSQAKNRNGWENQNHCMIAPENQEKKGDLLPQDWHLIWSSFLPLNCDEYFCKEFVKEQILFERLRQDAIRWQQIANKNYVWCIKCYQNLSYVEPNFQACIHCTTVYSEEETFNNRINCPACRQNYLNIVPNDPQKRQCGYGNCRRCFSLTSGSLPVGPERYDPTFKDGKLYLTSPEFATKFLSIAMPDTMEDKDHVAHIAWKYCNFVQGRLEVTTFE